MRSETEITRAHDMLTAIVQGEIPVVIGPATKANAIAALDALCWVLEHPVKDCGDAFAQNMKELERAAQLQGYCLTRLVGEPPKEAA